MGISWSNRPQLSRIAHWNRWARNGPVWSFRGPEMRQMVPNRKKKIRDRNNKGQDGKDQKKVTKKVEMKATSIPTNASKADIDASKPTEKLDMAKLVNVADKGAKRVEGLVSAAEAKAMIYEAEIAQKDEEIKMLAMELRRLDREIKVSEMETGKSETEVKTTTDETGKADNNVSQVKAEEINAGLANVKANKDARNEDESVQKADTEFGMEDNKLDSKIKMTDKETTATPETENVEMKEGPAIDEVNKDVWNDEKDVQKANAGMVMNETDVNQVDLAIVEADVEVDPAILEADVEVKKTIKDMKTFDDAWTRDMENTLIAMVAPEGCTLLSTPVRVAPEGFTVKERNNICNYWTEKLGLHQQNQGGLRRDVAYFGSM